MKTTGTINRAGRIRVEQARKRVRAYLAGEVVADTTQPRPVWEVPYYPTYYFPVADVRTDLLVPTATVTHCPSRGNAEYFTVKAGSREAEDAALRYVDSPIEELRDLIRLDWDAMDGWFEEDEEVYTHPRDPYTRGRHPGHLAPGAGRARRGGPGRLHQRPRAVRDRPPAALVLPQNRPAHGPADADRDRHPLPVQGPGPVLVGAARVAAWSRTWPGPTARRCPRARRSPAWSPSTPSGSTWSSMTSSSSGPSPSSASEGRTTMARPTPGGAHRRTNSAAARREARRLHMTGEAAHQTRLERILGARLAEDAVRQWPQSGERIDGRARIGEVEAHFVGLRLGVGRRHVSGDTIVVEWSTDYGDGRVYRNVSIAELRDGQAIRVTDYWGEPFTPPVWRKALATRLDMPRDGVGPASPPCPAWHAR